jgi:hypothetical protein
LNPITLEFQVSEVSLLRYSPLLREDHNPVCRR